MLAIVYIIITIIIVTITVRPARPNQRVRMNLPRTSCRWVSHRKRGCSLRVAALPGVHARLVVGYRANDVAAVPGASIDADETRTTTWANSTRVCCWTRCFNSILASQVSLLNCKRLYRVRSGRRY